MCAWTAHFNPSSGGRKRAKAGKKPGYPRVQGRVRSTSFTDQEVDTGARLDNGFVVLSTIRRSVVRWSRPREGTPRTVTLWEEADGWDACCSCAEVPIEPLPLTGQDTGSDLGREAFATLATGAPVEHARRFRVGERQLQRAQRRGARRVKGSRRRRKAVRLRARAHQQVRRARQDLHHVRTCITSGLAS